MSPRREARGPGATGACRAGSGGESGCCSCCCCGCDGPSAWCRCVAADASSPSCCVGAEPCGAPVLCCCCGCVVSCAASAVEGGAPSPASAMIASSSSSWVPRPPAAILRALALSLSQVKLSIPCAARAFPSSRCWSCLVSSIVPLRNRTVRRASIQVFVLSPFSQLITINIPNPVLWQRSVVVQPPVGRGLWVGWWFLRSWASRDAPSSIGACT